MRTTRALLLIEEHPRGDEERFHFSVRFGLTSFGDHAPEDKSCRQIIVRF